MFVIQVDEAHMGSKKDADSSKSQAYVFFNVEQRDAMVRCPISECISLVLILRGLFWRAISQHAFLLSCCFVTSQHALFLSIIFLSFCSCFHFQFIRTPWIVCCFVTCSKPVL